MSGGGPPSQACASCRHQRKRCDENCELAPYFPASRYREFLNAHKLFGVSNIVKLINAVEPHQRKETAESILMEGNLRSMDPVHGCLGIVRNLKSQIEYCEKELQLVNEQLAYFQQRELQQLQQQQQGNEKANAQPGSSYLPSFPLGHGFDAASSCQMPTPPDLVRL